MLSRTLPASLLQLSLIAAIGPAGCEGCRGEPVQPPSPSLEATVPPSPPDSGLTLVDAGTKPLPLDPEVYPLIDEKELGHLRWVLKIASQDLLDFTYFEARNQDDLTSFRYSIAFSVYFLALEQYHKLPAWSEAIRPAMDRFIQKLTQKPVWEYWATTSKGVPFLEPKMDKPYPESRDPVGEKNIMYSGHLGHAINLFGMLYRDFKWDKPGSIVFAWSDSEKYTYDNHTLEKVMHAQMKNNVYHSVCCEPNAVFPECNQHPVLSFMLYDQTHGSKLSEVNDLFFDFFVKRQLIDPESHETAMLFLVKQDQTLCQKEPYYDNANDLVVAPAVKAGLATLESASANGWTGAFMHAWQPKYIEGHYPFWQLHHVIEKGNGVAELKKENWEPLVQYGFFALVASEIGDGATRDKLLRHADDHYFPLWLDGTFHYPNDFNRSTHLNDKLLAMARANPKDGLHALHNRPLDAAHFAAPRVEGVSYPELVLRRAIYDPAKRALIVTTVGGSKKSGSSSFRVTQLDPARTYWLARDGVSQGKIQGQRELPLTASLEGPHTFVIFAE